jgi:hypothetical protein
MYHYPILWIASLAPRPSLFFVVSAMSEATPDEQDKISKRTLPEAMPHICVIN